MHRSIRAVVNISSGAEIYTSYYKIEDVYMTTAVYIIRQKEIGNRSQRHQDYGVFSTGVQGRSRGEHRCVRNSPQRPSAGFSRHCGRPASPRPSTTTTAGTPWRVYRQRQSRKASKNTDGYGGVHLLLWSTQVVLFSSCSYTRFEEGECGGWNGVGIWCKKYEYSVRY